MGTKLTMWEADEMIRVADTNHDSRVTYGDFVKLMKSMQSQNVSDLKVCSQEAYVLIWLTKTHRKKPEKCLCEL